MNLKNKISEIVLITLVVLAGGGYIYYSLLSDIRHESGFVSTIYLQKAESPTVKLDNINSKKQSSTSHKQQGKLSATRVSATPLNTEVRHEATISISGNIQSGSTSYTYSKKKRDTKNSYQDGELGSTSTLAYSSHRGRNIDDKLSAQTFGEVAITEPGAMSPFAVPKTPNSNPPTNGNGIILVDPGTYTTPGNELGEPIPVGEGLWIFMLLALGYTGWKILKKPY
ncbi:MAG: hypothetical protein H6Q19_348 [Bacteroidetes bacterium]|nr:hypothetical protein [Bacteroidota bacterium]